MTRRGWADYYRGRTVLVTGHTGFKGGWLVTWLKLLGARVVGLALEPDRRQPALFDVAGVGEDMASHIADIRDLDAVKTVFKRYTLEMVFHMAAQSIVRVSYREPVDTYMTNVMGTVHVLEAARLTPSMKAVVNVTSDKCYENNEWPWGYRETDPMGGADPYSASKGAAELVTAAYRRSFFSAPEGPVLASVRAGNVIGGGDWAEDRVVPDIARAVARGQAVTLRNPHAVRPWQHVLEPLCGYLLLGSRLGTDGLTFAEGWNFGPGDDSVVTVQELAERIVEAWGPDAPVLKLGAAGPEPDEATLLRLDISKARTRLDWQPVLTLQDAVQLTVEWYRSYHRARKSMREVMERQITDYMERATDQGQRPWATTPARAN